MYPFRCSYKRLFWLLQNDRCPGQALQDSWKGDTGRNHTGKEGPVQVLLVYWNIQLCCPVIIPHPGTRRKISTSVTNVIGNSPLIAGLTLHGRDCHDTRHHACSWCVEYFDNVDELYTHTRNKHHFECTICFNISPTAEELEEHIKEKHGGFQPSEQEIQAQRRGEERLEREERKKEKAEAEARRTAYFPCKECVEGFSTKRKLDKHTTDKHIFICGECLKTFKTKAERDAHMKTDHKEVTAQMMKQEKLLAEEYRKRESREEKDRRAKETWEKVWTEYAIKKSKQEAEERKQRKRKPSATQTKEEAERAEGDDRDEDEDYVPSEEPSSEDPPYEPTKKELKRADKEGDQ